MANDVATIVTIDIDCSQGNGRLELIQDYDHQDERKVELVNAVGYEYPQGFMRKPGGRVLGLTGKLVEGKPPFDFRKLQNSKEKFIVTISIANGASEQLQPCMVSSYSDSGDSDGKNDYKLEIVALRGRPL